MSDAERGTNGRAGSPLSEHGGAGVDRGRFSVRRKTEAVLRLLRGEELDAISRELAITAATVAQWRQRFLAAGQASFVNVKLKWPQGDGQKWPHAGVKVWRPPFL